MKQDGQNRGKNRQGSSKNPKTKKADIPHKSNIQDAEMV
jgi:hypothetical protein